MSRFFQRQRSKSASIPKTSEPIKKRLKILEIGGNIKPQAQGVPGWENAEIVTMDIDPACNPMILHNARTMPEDLYDQFDHVFASHVLEHFSYWETVDVIREWAKVVKPDGCLHILVPSLEWAARMVLNDQPTKYVLPHLYAGHVNKWDFHLAAFTMRLLRTQFAAAGLKVVAARSGEYMINVAGDTIKAEQHYVKGVKVKDESISNNVEFSPNNGVDSEGNVDRGIGNNLS